LRPLKADARALFTAPAGLQADHVAGWRPPRSHSPVVSKARPVAATWPGSVTAVQPSGLGGHVIHKTKKPRRSGAKSNALAQTIEAPSQGARSRLPAPNPSADLWFPPSSPNDLFTGASSSAPSPKTRRTAEPGHVAAKTGMISPGGGAYNGVPGRLCGSDAKGRDPASALALGDEQPWGWSLRSLVESRCAPLNGLPGIPAGKTFAEARSRPRFWRLRSTP
jgi:hypothetical protein